MSRKGTMDKDDYQRKLSAIRKLARAYRADPVDARDRPGSWGALEALLAEIEAPTARARTVKRGVAGPCHVADPHCYAPANLERVGEIRVGVCWACGLGVCTECSTKTRAYPGATGQRVRICNDCLDEAGLLARGGER